MTTTTQRETEKLANFFTPLAKYYNSELCNSIAFDAIQIHGGAGFTVFEDAGWVNPNTVTEPFECVGDWPGALGNGCNIYYE